MAAKSNRIKIPHQPFGTFLRAAFNWLSKTIDAKTGLEIRLANLDGKLHLSAGADSNYMEAVLIVADPADLEALTHPIFLDIPTLNNYGFDQDGLTMVVPAVEGKADQRVTFSVPGFNFRVPRKEGKIWKRNYMPALAASKIDGLILDKEAFEKFREHLHLPNSFKTERRDFQFCLEVSPNVGFKVYGYDGLGALCHTFKNERTVGKEGLMVFTEDFFSPCKEFEVDSHVAFGVSDTQGFGEFKSDSSGVEILRWTQPRYQKKPSPIPKALEQQRTTHIATLTVGKKEMYGNVLKACMFLAGTEMRSVPIEFYTVGGQYALITNKPSGEGEVRAEGELVLAPGQNIEINLQAACVKDYLNEFEDRAAIQMEVLKSTVIFSQSLEDKELLYWMPVMPRTGG